MSLQTPFANTHPEPLSYRLPEAWELPGVKRSPFAQLPCFLPGGPSNLYDNSYLVNLQQVREIEAWTKDSYKI